MKKSKLASGLVVTGGALALALAFTVTPSQVAAIPYASHIRFENPGGPDTELSQFLGSDLMYTLNENVDAVTVEVYNVTDAVVVRTFNFTSPDPETARGRHGIFWDNRDDSNNLLPISGDDFTIRVRVQKEDSSTTWTYITGNSSNATAKATQQKTIFNGFSSNDLQIPLDPTSDQFGMLLAANSFVAPGGVVLFGADLAPILGNGGGLANIKGQHDAAVPGNFALWKADFDPLDPTKFWWGGQTAAAKAGVFSIAGPDPSAWQTLADTSWTTGLFPRGFAVGLNDSNERVAFIAMGNQLYRAAMDTTYPHTLSGEVTLTPATLDGAARYAQDVKVDADGNVYYLTRLPDGDGRLWRWNKAEVDAAPGVQLDETNAAWIVRAPAGSINLNDININTETGEVLVGVAQASAIGGIYSVGNTADAELAAKPYVLTAADRLVSYAAAAPFPGMSASQLGHGVAQDWKGNLYATNRVGEEIHSWSPPARATVEDPPAQYDFTTETPAGYTSSITTPKSNLVFVDKTDGSPDNLVRFNSLREAILSFGPGGQNNGLVGTNRIEITGFGPYDEELPDMPAGFDADAFDIKSMTAPTLVLQRGSTWEVGVSMTINDLVIAASSTTTPTGTLVSSTGGTQSFTNSWITALPAAAASYTQASDIPAGISDGSAAYDGSLVRAGDGLTISGAAVTATNTLINQHTRGVVSSSGSLTSVNSRVVSNNGNGVTNTGADLTFSGTNTRVSNNAGTGISTSGGAFSIVGTYASPAVLANNTVAGIAINGGSSYEIRNTLVNNSPVGLDIGSGATSYGFGDYRVTDSIFSNGSTAGIRIADAKGFSMERVTLHDNGAGILDPASRNDFWSLELRDTIISGPGGTGIQSGTVGGSDSIYLDYSALVTAGPNALTTANTASAGTFVGGATVNADPEYRSTTFSTNRLGPDFFLAPSSPDYLGAAAPPEDLGGSPFQNLGGGSRWTLGSSITTITVGNAGTQLYPTLADAVDGVNSLGTTGGTVLTILIETNLTETRVSRLGVDTGEGGGVLIRPADGLDLTVDWATTPPLSGVFYSGQLAIGANQGVNNNLVMTNNVVLDGKPAGSPSGTALTFSGPGRHINLTGGAKNTTIRNVRLNSTLSSGAVIAVNALNAGGVDSHPEGLVIENNLIQALASTAHVGIVLQAQSGVLTTAQEDLTIRNNRFEYQSSAVFLYPSGFNAEIHGNTFYGRQANAAGVDVRGFYFFTSANYAAAPTSTTNIYNNVFDLVGLNAATNGQALISLDYGASSNVQTINFYNNFVTMQHTGTAVPSKYQAFVVGGVVGPQLNVLHNSFHMRANSLGIISTLNTANTGLISISSINPAGVAKVNTRNNLVRVEEPQIAVFVLPESKLADNVENYNTVYRVPIDPGTGVVSPFYGRIGTTNYQTLAEWQAASSTGANSDEAVIAIAPDANPAAPAFTGVWTLAPDRVTDPNAPIPANYRWTAVPGDSAVWGGVPGLLTNLPGGNADIDGTARNTGKPYRGAHEAATMPGDDIPPDEEPPAGELGDINGDELINVADVTELANIIAAGQQGTLDLEIADINGDLVINDADVDALADMIVNP